MGVKVEDHILLLLSIKKPQQWVDLDHIHEKVSRDVGVSMGLELSIGETEEVLKDLERRELVDRSENGFRITEEGKKLISSRLPEVGSKLNLSYRMVYDAKRYYPHVAKLMVPFLADRACSVVKIFSDDRDPIGKVSPSFVRYAKPAQKIMHRIDSERKLLDYVDIHAIDFIPYVHPWGENRPDWLIMDLDAGEAYEEHPRGFELLKIVAKCLCDVLEEYEISPAIKFSGSRGIQVWARIPEYDAGGKDPFALFRNAVILLQRKTEEKLAELPKDIMMDFRKITPGEKSITTSTVAKKEQRRDQILIDWSSMKPSGDVRAPYSIHYKTGLVSCGIRDLDSFIPSQAEIDSVIKNLDRFRFELAESDGEKLLAEVRAQF